MRRTFGEYHRGKCQCGGTREGEYRGSILNHERERERRSLLSFEIFTEKERERERGYRISWCITLETVSSSCSSRQVIRAATSERENRGCFAFRGQVNYGRRGAVPLEAERKHDLSLRVAKERE